MDQRLDFARELERRDRDVADRLVLLGRLGDEVERLVTGAGEVERFFARLPSERAHLDVAAADAAAALERARAAVAAAEAELAAARKDDRRGAAERAVAAAGTELGSADERVRRASDRRAALEQEAEQRAAEAGELERAATALAAELEAAPRVSRTEPPAPGVAGVVAWGGRARAAVFVVRSGLEGERERVVREANELAASVLGEPLHTANVAAVRRRLEELLA
ncbi:MAG TPA: hypothetical protein VEY87_00755 [Gaiellaceae bacterium]|nr:hypothetical protein [Gaiellaceae bacterium]